MTTTTPSDHNGVNAPRFPLKLAASPGVVPDDAMSEAGRKILFHQFEIMLKHEPGVRQDGNIDAIHDMRVATRRMRSAIKLFHSYYKKGSPVRVFERSLKTIASTLGEVRDMDVFQDKIRKYAAELPEADRESLHNLSKQFNTDTTSARERLVNYLDGSHYRNFIATFHEFLTTPGAGSQTKFPLGEPHIVRHVVPPLLYGQYSTMRSYETLLSVAALDTLHDLRIEGKRLRYTLEFFTEVLGSEAKTVINAVKSLQDHLGDLQDARVAVDILQNHLKNADERDDLRPILRYLTTRENEKQRLLNTVNEAWAGFTDAKTRKALALAVATL
jgi:CHAD domain-containing protein